MSVNHLRSISWNAPVSEKHFVDTYCAFKTTIWIFFLITSEFPWFVEKNIWVSWRKNGFSLLFWFLKIELLSRGHLSGLFKSLWVLALSTLHSGLGSETDHGKSNWLKSTGREKDTELSFSERISCFTFWKLKRIVK